LLGWLYVGRLVLVTGVFLGAAFSVVGGSDDPQMALAAAVFGVGMLASGGSFLQTHVRGRSPGETFLYAHVLLDVLLATAIVDMTGGPTSTFTPLYILVIAEGALLLPLPGGVLMGGLATSLYFADIFLLHEELVRVNLAIVQIGLFAMVALATGFLGDRLRRAGIALGEVESELRQLRHDTGDILTNVTSGILTVDSAGRLVYLNPAGETLLGIDAERWIGTAVVTNLDEIAPGMGSLLRRSIEDGMPVRRYKTRARRNGEVITLGVSTAVLRREEGAPPSATAIFQDITESERVEALNRRTERLEAVAELSASLAHEIKNPLASIRSAVEQIASSRLGEEDRETLQKLVVAQSDRLSRLLSEFLEFSGLRMGQSEQLDLAELVRDCVTLVRQHPECGDGILVQVDGAEEPLLIPGDADLLHRAVFNLLLNAAQFSAPDGRVHVRLDRGPEKLPQEAKDVSRAVRLSVLDTGPGVPSDQIDRIFNPFFTTRTGGSGLGLSVVHRAVQVHGGVVLVGNSAGRGAEFVVYLPGPTAGEEVS